MSNCAVSTLIPYARAISPAISDSLLPCSMKSRIVEPTTLSEKTRPRRMSKRTLPSGLRLLRIDAELFNSCSRFVDPVCASRKLSHPQLNQASRFNIRSPIQPSECEGPRRHQDARSGIARRPKCPFAFAQGGSTAVGEIDRYKRCRRIAETRPTTSASIPFLSRIEFCGRSECGLTMR